MSYIYFALSAAVFYGGGILVSKFTSKHALKTWPKLWIYFLIIQSLIALVVIPFIAPITFPHQAISPIFLNSLFFVLALIPFFQGILIVDASVAAPFGQIQSIIIALLAYLLLKETFPFNSYLWILLIIIGAILVSTDEKLKFNSIFQPGLQRIILANTLFSFSNIASGFALKTQTIWNLIFWTSVLNLIFSFFFFLIFRPDIKAKLKQISPLFFQSTFQFLGTICLFNAYQQNLTVSAVLSMLTSPFVFLVTIITSKWFPKLLEHHSTKVYAVRGLGLFIILLAAIKLTLSQ